MTETGVGDEGRRSRWLPIAVVSVFGLVLLVEIVVILAYGNYRNIIEEDGVEVSFEPAAAAPDSGERPVVEWAPGLRITGGDGSLSVVEDGGVLEVRTPGTLVVRFRAPDAGADVHLDYRFGRRDRDAVCRLAFARVASRYGVDYIARRTLSGRKTKGRFKHYLADHAGWFELSFEVNEAAAEAGFAIGRPELVRD